MTAEVMPTWESVAAECPDSDAIARLASDQVHKIDSVRSELNFDSRKGRISLAAGMGIAFLLGRIGEEQAEQYMQFAQALMVSPSVPLLVRGKNGEVDPRASGIAMDGRPNFPSKTELTFLVRHNDAKVTEPVLAQWYTNPTFPSILTCEQSITTGASNVVSEIARALNPEQWSDHNRYFRDLGALSVLAQMEKDGGEQVTTAIDTSQPMLRDIFKDAVQHAKDASAQNQGTDNFRRILQNVPELYRLDPEFAEGILRSASRTAWPEYSNGYFNGFQHNGVDLCAVYARMHVPIRHILTNLERAVVAGTHAYLGYYVSVPGARIGPAPIV